MWIALANHPGIEQLRLLLAALLRLGRRAAAGRGRATRFERLTGQRLGGGWGMTETSPAGTNHAACDAPRKPGSIGLPLPRHR